MLSLRSTVAVFLTRVDEIPTKVELCSARKHMVFRELFSLAITSPGVFSQTVFVRFGIFSDSLSAMVLKIH